MECESGIVMRQFTNLTARRNVYKDDYISFNLRTAVERLAEALDQIDADSAEATKLYTAWTLIYEVEKTINTCMTQVSHVPNMSGKSAVICAQGSAGSFGQTALGGGFFGRAPSDLAAGSKSWAWPWNVG